MVVVSQVFPCRPHFSASVSLRVVHEAWESDAGAVQTVKYCLHLSPTKHCDTFMSTLHREMVGDVDVILSAVAAGKMVVYCVQSPMDVFEDLPEEEPA